MFKNMQLDLLVHYWKNFEIRKEISDNKMMVMMDHYYDEENSIRISDDWALLEGIVWIFRDWLVVLQCAFLGCDFQDDSPPNAGESGAWGYSCSRCGFGDSGYMTG